MKRILLVVSFLLLPSAAGAEKIDLRGAERVAIQQNLNLKAQEDVTRAAEALVRGRYGLYDSRVEAFLAEGASRTRNRIQIDDDQLSTFFNANPTNELDYRDFNLSLSKVFRTGAELRGEFNNRREASNTTVIGYIDPAYISEGRLSLVQPLLRNFGREVTEQAILFAVKDRQQERENLREQAFTLVRDVRNAYFDVLRYRDSLAYRETSVELARQVLKENRARVEAGVLPPVENLEAEVGLQLRERELLDARRSYEDALDRLTLLLNLTEQVEVSENAPPELPLEVNEVDGLQSALQWRPDVLRRIREIERLELSERVAKNRSLPELNLGASYGHSGLARSYRDDLEDLASGSYPNWEVGLTFSYPLENTEARNELLRTRILLRGNRTLLGQLRAEIRKEIRAASRDLEVSRKKIDVTDLSTRLARERLQTLLKRKEVGLATTRDVLEGEEDLAQSRTDHIAAVADYNAAVTEYLRATGLLLEREGIRIAEEIDPDSEHPLVRMEGL